MRKIIGPFEEVVDVAGISLKGPVKAELLQVKKNQGVLVHNEKIEAVLDFDELTKALPSIKVERIDSPAVLLPGFIDCHTHICWAGSRANDYAARLDGKTYLEIAQAGGGIWSTVKNTRAANANILENGILRRSQQHLRNGVTTIEVKSGYGLGIEEEIKILQAIQNVNQIAAADLISTCLAAHMKPKDFEGSNTEYLKLLATDLLPKLKEKGLTNRIDIFIEKSAFSTDESLTYLKAAKAMGFEITVHGDQFSTGGSKVAVEINALSVDHLEASGDAEIDLIAQSETVAVALPGASIGLGMEYTPARKLLDKGACVAIASDWNPGSAPMGDLLTQACILGVYEKLSIAETLCGLTTRAAAALGLDDRGSFQRDQLADFQMYPVKDYREIFYHQGSIKPTKVWKNGVLVE